MIQQRAMTWLYAAMAGDHIGFGCGAEHCCNCRPGTGDDPIKDDWHTCRRCRNNNAGDGTDLKAANLAEQINWIIGIRQVKGKCSFDHLTFAAPAENANPCPHACHLRDRQIGDDSRNCRAGRCVTNPHISGEQ